MDQNAEVAKAEDILTQECKAVQKLDANEHYDVISEVLHLAHRVARAEMDFTLNDGQFAHIGLSTPLRFTNTEEWQPLHSWLGKMHWKRLQGHMASGRMEIAGTMKRTKKDTDPVEAGKEATCTPGCEQIGEHSVCVVSRPSGSGIPSNTILLCIDLTDCDFPQCNCRWGIRKLQTTL